MSVLYSFYYPIQARLTRLATRLTNYLELNGLLSSSQFGFRKNHSTLHPLIHFMNFITNAQNNKEHSTVWLFFAISERRSTLWIIKFS
jgi:hypothetical protein